MKIGVGVEGPSDLQFWSKILPKHFRGLQFDVRNMKNRDKLIRATPDLFEEFRSLKRVAGFIILDRDQDSCVSAVLDRFDPATRTEFTRPVADRFLHLCVAVKRLECWYLADAQAIVAAIPGVQWQPPADTATCNGKTEIKRLLQSRSRAEVSYNEIEFAKTISPRFSPTRGKSHSASFKHCWQRIDATCQTV